MSDIMSSDSNSERVSDKGDSVTKVNIGAGSSGNSEDGEKKAPEEEEAV